jgi:flagellar biosynthesis protein FlhA
MNKKSSANLSFLSENTDALVALGLVGILALMMIPVPTVLLDIFLSFSIAFAIVILLVSVYTLQPLEFSVFPSMLLLSTLFRLSLNVASTRLIILNGAEGPSAAGDVIQAFGQFVVGGDYLVGIIIFLILVLINFIVITKGAGRIAEVAARFTLDAMPGKQMSIDADLNAGLISDDEARERRIKISRESDFYGAMDGASKFVRGDAIAGIIITSINIVGGLLIGVIQHGMDVSEAARAYTILTVGDGLITQIPALIVSTAAGLVVTRAGSGENLGKEMSSQLLKSKPMAIAAVILLLFGLVPGLPNLPFLFLALLTGSISFLAKKIKEKEVLDLQETMQQESEEAPIESIKPVNPFDVLEMEVGYALIPLVDSDKKGELLDRIRALRNQLAMEMGIVVPPIHIRDNLQLKANSYSIILKGVEIASTELMMNQFLAMDAGEAKGQVEGIPTSEPAFGLPALWVNDENRERAQLMGYTVVDPATVVTTHLVELIRNNAHELIGRQDLQAMLDQLAKSHPKLVEEVVPNLLPFGAVLKVLQNLLKERVSIRDILSILEALADYGAITKSPEILTEYVRQRLSRAITRQYQNEMGEINVITLDHEVEDVISRSVQQGQQETNLALDPSTAKSILSSLKSALENSAAEHYQPVVLCPSGIRAVFKKLAELVNPHLVAISYDEVSPNCRVKSIATVRL